MSVNTFDNKSTVRIGRAVRGYEKSVLGNANQTRRRVPIAGGGTSSGGGGVLVEVTDNGVGLPSYNCKVYKDGYSSPSTGSGEAVPVVTHPLTSFAPDTRMVAILGSALTTGEV